MRPYLKLLMLICCVSALSNARGQVASPIDLIDSHFVGTWSGTNHDFTRKPPVTNAVTIAITEDKKHVRLLFDYKYNTKGQKGYDHLQRFFSFDIPHSTLVFQWKGDRKQPARMSDFDEFARTGYGSFSVSMTNVESGVTRYYVGTFHLSADNFSYEWKVSKDGTSFSDNGDWKLTRQNTIP